jgi:hypothetical protein
MERIANGCAVRRAVLAPPWGELVAVDLEHGDVR